MRKRILSIFLVLCMVFTMLPVSAMAEEAYTNMDAGTEGPASDSSWGSLSLEDNGDREEDRPAEVFFSQALITTGPAITHYDVWVGGVQVTSENMTSVTGPAITGSVTYDPNSSTLTLDGAEITGVYADGGNQYGIYTAGNLNIELVNSYSAIETLDAENQAGDNTGIYVSGNLTISGDKTLRVTSGKANNGSNYGIRVGGNLTIDTTVITQVDSSLAESHGVSLFGEDALLTVEEAASLSATGGAAAKSYGIYLEGENARMTLKGEVGAMGSAATELSAGIFMPGVINTQITIDGSEVFAIGSSADIDSYGLLMFGDLLVKEDSQFYATAGQADNMMTGLYTKELTVDGGYVWAGTAEHDAERSFGIFGLSSITILDGALRAYSDGEGEIAQALSAVPAYGSSYIPLVRVYDNNYMGDFIADEDFNNDSISSFKQISIENNVIYDLWVGGVRVSNRNRRDITGPGIDGFISYDPENNTLTLDDAVILEAYVDENGNKYGIYAPSGDLKLELICEHSNIFLQGPLEDKDGAGIYANSNLTIFGEGKLVITGGATTGDHGDSYGIHVENGDLTVEGVELIAAGAPVEGIGSASYGICVHDGNLIIRDDASVTAIGAEADVASYGVYLGGSGVNLLVESGSSLEATGGDTEGVSYGIHMEQEANTLVIDGKVTAIGGYAEEESIGILAYMIGVNDGAILEASGGFATDVSYGICSDNFHIYGGQVEADSREAGLSQAMCSAPTYGRGYNPVINAGSNGALAEYVTEADFRDNINSYRYALIEPYTEYDLWVGGVRVDSRNKGNINGEGIEGIITYNPEENILTLNDAVISEAYVDENGNKYGIYAPSGDLKLELICEHSNIFLQGPLEDKDGAGIYANSNLTIFGEGKLVITGGATTGDHGDSYGIHVENGDLTVEGVELIAAGAPVEGIGSASYGICVHDGNLIIRDDASVTAIGAEADVASYGVYLGGSGVNLLVESGSSLEATGGDTEGVSYGIHMEQEANTLVIDGRVTAIGGSAEEESIGILAHMIGVNAGAILEASGRSATTVSYGIFSSRIHIYGGWVEADSSSGAEISQAMTSVPIFDSAYTHLNNAGQNGADAIYMNDAELARGIGSFRYVEITPYTPVEDNDNGGSYIPVPVPTAKPAEAVDGKTETKATVDSNGTASISITEKDITNAIANAKAEAEKNGVDPSEIKVVIHVSTEGKDATDYSLGLSKAAQQLLIDNKITGLELVFDDSDITLGINQAALTEINRQAKADVRISISKTDKSKLSTGAQDAIGDRPVYDFKATYQNGSRSVTSFGDGEVYVRIPYTPADDEDEGYLYIVYVDDQGNISRVADSTYDANSGSMIFLSNHFSVYGVGYAAPEVKLTDIDTHWAKESINYVVGRGLILGRTQTTFSPDQAITRAELVTALGKLAGIDTEEYTTNSFKDVKANSSNRPYIEWAYSKDILKGTEGQKFEPNRLVTREEMADIMANYVKAMGYKLPAIRNVLPYADASVIDSSYTDAVKSLQQAGILMGKGDNQFHPKTKASRAEVAAMLHRFIKLTIDPTSAQGWTVNDDGQMMYYRNMKLATGWQTIAGVKYFFNSDGSLKTGWVKDDSGNTRYYSGRQMLVGFWNISTKCSLKTYYFDCNGIMYSSKWLQTQDGKEYYFNTDGTLAGDIRPDVSEADETCVITGK